MNKVVYENEYFRVSETGKDYDFVAIIENKKDYDIKIEFTDFNVMNIKANEWLGLLSHEYYTTMERPDYSYSIAFENEDFIVSRDYYNEYFDNYITEDRQKTVMEFMDGGKVKATFNIKALVERFLNDKENEDVKQEDLILYLWSWLCDRVDCFEFMDLIEDTNNESFDYDSFDSDNDRIIIETLTDLMYNYITRDCERITEY